MCFNEAENCGGSKRVKTLLAVLSDPYRPAGMLLQHVQSCCHVDHALHGRTTDFDILRSKAERSGSKTDWDCKASAFPPPLRGICK